jgi:hypothetical protein
MSQFLKRFKQLKRRGFLVKKPLKQQSGYPLIAFALLSRINAPRRLSVNRRITDVEAGPCKRYK